MILLEFSMSPLGKGESVGAYVARSLEIVEQSGLDYRLHTMGTILEGERDKVLAVVKQCYEAMRTDCPRILVGRLLQNAKNAVFCRAKAAFAH
jgi:uncharacterized protein (TIGR00106 family)